MKFKYLNTTLSCILKCIRIIISVINKKIILGLFIFSSLGACTAPSAMLGPVLSFTNSRSTLQAGLSYGSNEIIIRNTGKTPLENLKEFSERKNNKKKNIQKDTLESEDFYLMVKNKIEKTSGILKLPSQ